MEKMGSGENLEKQRRSGQSDCEEGEGGKRIGHCEGKLEITSFNLQARCRERRREPGDEE